MNPSYAYTNRSPNRPPGAPTPTTAPAPAVAKKSTPPTTPPRLRRRGFTIGADDDDDDSSSGERERDNFNFGGGGAGGGGGGGGGAKRAKSKDKDPYEKDRIQTTAGAPTMPTTTVTTTTAARKQRRRGRSLRKTALLRPGRGAFDSASMPGVVLGVGVSAGNTLVVPIGTAVTNGHGNPTTYTGGIRRSNSPGLKLPPAAINTTGVVAGPPSASAIYDSADDSEGTAYRGGGGVANRFSGYPVRGRSGSVVMVMPRTRQEEIDSAADTAYWGWVVLGATWVVFVVGMGSVLGVWEWAWDVPGSPFAKLPEHEAKIKDEQGAFPIDGYYPALIILTCIMAWVWVVVAWVGMKYFKHAKIQPPSDDL